MPKVIAGAASIVLVLYTYDIQAHTVIEPESERRPCSSISLELMLGLFGDLFIARLSSLWSMVLRAIVQVSV